MRKVKNLLQHLLIKAMSREGYVKYLRKRGVVIGEGCDIEKTADFGSEPWLITIGDHTRITRGVKFITHDGGLWVLRNLGLIGKEDVKYGPIRIGNNCNISWDVTIMPNVVIGNNCVIAAGAVITHSVPDNTIWGGVPARQIETIEAYCEKVRAGVCVPAFSLSEREKRNILMEKYPEWFSAPIQQQ